LYIKNIAKDIRGSDCVFYNTRDIGPWPSPEVPANVNRTDLGNLWLTEQEIDDIVAFLNTLSDDCEPGQK
jgi:cytochrome c peroxidase